MSRQQIIPHYARLLRLWPKDRLRAEQIQFQRLLQQRIQAAPSGSRDELKEVNAAYHLLDNTLAKQYGLSKAIMSPESKPDHYTALARELEEIPDRTWLGNIKNRLKNLVRFQ